MALKKIGPVSATLLVVGNMVGSGIFLLPASLAATGSSTILGWLASLAGALLLAGVFAALGGARPTPNGLADWPARIHPTFGFVSWFSYWASGIPGNVGLVVAGVGYLAALLPVVKSGFPALAAMLAIIWGFTFLCFLGARFVTRVSGLTLLIGLAPIVVATVMAAGAFSPHVFAESWNISGKPVIATVGPSMLIVFWAFLGLESAAIAGAVVENPARNVPIAALAGVGIAGVIYITACSLLMGVIPASELKDSTAPFADVVSRLGGPTLGAVIAVCALLKILGTIIGWFLVCGEITRAGRAEGYLPRFLSEADPDVLPRRALVTMAVLMSLSAVVTLSPTLNNQFNTLLNLTVTLFMVVYGLCSLALALDGERRAGTRLVGLAGAAFCVWVIVASDLSTNWQALVFAALTVPVGLVFAMRKRKPALA